MTDRPKTPEGFDGWVRDYAARDRPAYERLSDILRSELKDAVDELGIGAIVQVRPKSVASFAEKILRKRKYTDPLRQMADLCGARIIVSRKDHLEPVCEFIRRNFEIMWSESLDTAARLADREFGYRSVHYVVSLKEDAAEDPFDVPAGDPLRSRYDESERDEENLFGGRYKAEIQVRTLLQHAWATVIHDPVYKAGFEVPRHLHRESGRIAALLENSDEGFARLIRGIEYYRSDFGAYMSRDEMASEVATLKSVYAHDPGNVGIACRIAQISEKLGDTETPIEVLLPHSDKDIAEVHLHLGLARFRTNGDLTDLTRAADLAPQEATILRALAAAYSAQGDTNKALDVYGCAHDIAPDEPDVLAGLLRCRLLSDGHISSIALMRPNMDAAITTCRDRAEVGVDLPETLYDSGFLSILTGKPFAGLSDILKAVRLSLTIDPILQARKDIEQVIAALDAAPAPKGKDDRTTRLIDDLECARRVLLIGTVATLIERQKHVRRKLEAGGLEVGEVKEAKTMLTEITKRLKTHRQALAELASRAGNGESPGIKEPVVIVAGGCDEKITAQIDEYRGLLSSALTGFPGTIISGGTTSGIAGLVGDLKCNCHKLTYLPETLPEDAKAHDGYDEVRRSPGTGDDFSVMEPIQNWIDLLADGHDPADVRLLGINGGDIAAFEYRLALGMGASVGVLVDSGRAASAIMTDPLWHDVQGLALLPSDPASAQALVMQNASEPIFDGALRDEMGEQAHEEYRNTHMKRAASDDPAMVGWDKLPEHLRESNIQQFDYIAAQLAWEGLEIRKTGDKAVAPYQPDDEMIDRMAEREHGRWNVERSLAGWRLGQRDHAAKTSPYLVAWPDLDDDVKKWDVEAVKNVFKVVAGHGYEVVGRAED